MNRELQIKCLYKPGQASATLRITLQTHRGTAFSPDCCATGFIYYILNEDQKRLTGLDSVVLRSHRCPEIIREERKLRFYVRGQSTEKDDAVLIIKAEYMCPINSAIAAYNDKYNAHI